MSWRRLWVLLIGLVVGVTASNSTVLCPGAYCGRRSPSSTACAACEVGFRTDGFVCQPCTQTMEAYSSLFLFVILLLPHISHMRALRFFGAGDAGPLLAAAAIGETIAAAIFALLMFPPVGRLHLHTCPVRQVADFYTYLHNPQPECGASLHCASEAVFPRITWVLVVDALNVPCALMVRGLLAWRRPTVRSISLASLSHTLHQLPFHALFYVIFSGLLYFAIPFMILLSCVLVLAWDHAYAAASRPPAMPLVRRAAHVVPALALLAVSLTMLLSLFANVPTAQYPAVVVLGTLAPTVIFYVVQSCARAARVCRNWVMNLER